MNQDYVNAQAHVKPHERSCWAATDRWVNSYADSLNFAHNRMDLPNFLLNYLFDWHFKNSLYPCLSNISERISFRKAIIDRVQREDALNWIINSHLKGYDRCYDPKDLEEEMGTDAYFESYPNFPYMDRSWRALAEIRLAEIIDRKKNFMN